MLNDVVLELRDQPGTPQVDQWNSRAVFSKGHRDLVDITALICFFFFKQIYCIYFILFFGFLLKLCEVSWQYHVVPALINLSMTTSSSTIFHMRLRWRFNALPSPRRVKIVTKVWPIDANNHGDIIPGRNWQAPWNPEVGGHFWPKRINPNATRFCTSRLIWVPPKNPTNLFLRPHSECFLHFETDHFVDSHVKNLVPHVFGIGMSR